MFSRAALCKRYLDDAEQLAANPVFRTLESGRADASCYDTFLRHVAQTHLHGPQTLALLFSIAPPESAARLVPDLLEALKTRRDGWDRPGSLEALLIAAGLASELAALRAQAQEDFDAIVCANPQFGCLRDLGLALQIEAVGFDFLLERMGRRIADFLQRYAGLPRDALGWFLRTGSPSRTAEGLNGMLIYIEHYGFDPAAVDAIVDTVLLENLFVKRYFAMRALPSAPL